MSVERERDRESLGLDYLFPYNDKRIFYFILKNKKNNNHVVVVLFFFVALSVVFS